MSVILEDLLAGRSLVDLSDEELDAMMLTVRKGRRDIMGLRSKPKAKKTATKKAAKSVDMAAAAGALSPEAAAALFAALKAKVGK